METMPPYENASNDDEWYAVYTIQLGELVENGLFDWSCPYLDWSEAAYNEEQYERVCKYFIDRFYWKEISMIPARKWADYLRRKLVYELMPRFKPLYEMVEDGISPLQIENEYYKNRTINSAYPETLLSGNSDYITDGSDEEFQRVKDGDWLNKYNEFANGFVFVDELLLNELENMFISMYTLNINTGW